VRPGLFHSFVYPDWTPLPEMARYGQALHTVDHILAAAEALAGAPDPKTRQILGSLVDTMLRFAWDDERGGFHFGGPSFGRAYVEDMVLFIPNKYWWAQAAGLKALLSMAQLFPNGSPYAEYFVRQWSYVKKYIVDPRHGGWMRAGLDTNPRARKLPKGSPWKDASHEVEALLDCLRALDSA
jgi:mannobiose 2-epimerase